MLSKGLQRTSQPPVKVGELKAPESYGVTSSELYKNAAKKHKDSATSAMNAVLKSEQDYGVRQKFDWDKTSRPCWHKPLTELQKRFKRDEVFIHEGERHITPDCHIAPSMMIISCTITTQTSQSQRAWATWTSHTS